MSMNIFRLCGDMSHVFSILVLLLRLRVAKNAQGACVCGCLLMIVYPVIIPRNDTHPIVSIYLSALFVLAAATATRCFGSDARTLSPCLCHSVSGFIYDILLPLQFYHEGFVHCRHCFHYLHHQIQRTHQINLRQGPGYLLALEVRRGTVCRCGTYNSFVGKRDQKF